MKSRASLWLITYSRPSLVCGVSLKGGSMSCDLQKNRFYRFIGRFYVTGSYSWACQPIDYSNDPEALRALNMAWFFYISKFVDMFDSFFFVLKKKFTHLSFLHVFHHGIMPFECWWGARYAKYTADDIRFGVFFCIIGLSVAAMEDLLLSSMLVSTL